MTPDELSEMRLFAIAAPMIRPLLEKRRINTYNRLIMAYRDGRVEPTLVAELSVISALETEINQKEQHYLSMENKK